MELLGGPVAAAGSIGDSCGGLVAPLEVEEVERVLQRRGIPPVVLREDEHEATEGADELTPGARVLVLILPEGRLQRLVKEWEVDQCQVDHLIAQRALLLGSVLDPLGDARADPCRAGAADYDRDALARLRLVCAASSAARLRARPHS